MMVRFNVNGMRRRVKRGRKGRDVLDIPCLMLMECVGGYRKGDDMEFQERNVSLVWEGVEGAAMWSGEDVIRKRKKGEGSGC